MLRNYLFWRWNSHFKFCVMSRYISRYVAFSRLPRNSSQSLKIYLFFYFCCETFFFKWSNGLWDFEFLLNWWFWVVCNYLNFDFVFTYFLFGSVFPVIFSCFLSVWKEHDTCWEWGVICEKNAAGWIQSLAARLRASLWGAQLRPLLAPQCFKSLLQSNIFLSFGLSSFIILCFLNISRIWFTTSSFAFSFMIIWCKGLHFCVHPSGTCYNIE